MGVPYASSATEKRTISLYRSWDELAEGFGCSSLKKDEIVTVVLSEDDRTELSTRLGQYVKAILKGEKKTWDECYPRPVKVAIPGKPKSKFEFGIADLRKQIKVKGDDKVEYQVPVQVLIHEGYEFNNV